VWSGPDSNVSEYEASEKNFFNPLAGEVKENMIGRKKKKRVFLPPPRHALPHSKASLFFFFFFFSQVSLLL
jgi:hypothetical protein